MYSSFFMCDTIEIVRDEGLFMGIVLVVLLVAVVVIPIFSCITTYNRMVKYRNKVKESLRLIDIHLKLRFDLIPNLVSTVKGYAKHEKEIFDKLIETRKLAVGAKEEKEKLEYANELVPQMRHVLAVAEDYPELKADSLFKSLMEELVLIEDKIAASRRFYDSNVSEYNTLIKVFPNNMIASMFNFEEMELFKIDVGEGFASKIDL